MIENLTRLQIDKKLALSYPTLDMIQEKAKDYKTLPLKVYLEKYYQNLGTYTIEIWSKAMLKLVNPAFNEETRGEMIYNFGYTSLDKHDFTKQNQFYLELKNDGRLDEDTRKFIGFMAGTHFFDEYINTLKQVGEPIPIMENGKQKTIFGLKAYYVDLVQL